MLDTDAALDWVFEEGQHIPDLRTLFAELVPRIVATGVPVDRMNFGSTLVHPHYRVQAMGWTSAEGMSEPVRLTFEAMTSPTFVGGPMHAVIESGRPTRWPLTAPDARETFDVFGEFIDDGYVDYMAMPLSSRGVIIGVITFATRTVDGFGERRGSALIRSMRAIAPLLALIRSERIAHDLMATYVGPETGPRVLAGRVRPGDAGRADRGLRSGRLIHPYAGTRPAGPVAAVRKHSSRAGLIDSRLR